MSRKPVSEDGLDALLERARGTGDCGARIDAAMADLVAETMRQGPPRARRRRRIGIGLAGLLAGVGLVGFLTAPTAPSDWWLRTPPFQELPEGWLRTTEYIPIVWRSPDGEEERCRTYIELMRADPDLVARVDAAILARDWTDFGQDLYETLPGTPPATSVESEVTQLALPLLQEFAGEVIPGLDSPDTGPAVGAYATTCRTGI